MDAYTQQKAEKLLKKFDIENLPTDEFQLAMATASIIVPHAIDLIGIIQPPKDWPDKEWREMLSLDYGQRLIIACMFTVIELDRATTAGQTWLKPVNER